MVWHSETSAVHVTLTSSDAAVEVVTNAARKNRFNRLVLMMDGTLIIRNRFVL